MKIRLDDEDKIGISILLIWAVAIIFVVIYGPANTGNDETRLRKFSLEEIRDICRKEIGE